MNNFLTLTITTLFTIGLYQLSNPSQVDYQLRFENYTQKYGKVYTPAEKIYRQQVYEEKMKMIEAHNADPTQTYKMGENKFTDLTQEEFVGIYLRAIVSTSQIFEEYIPTNDPAPYINWSNLTRVKDQGLCGSCWAFSAVGAIESIFRVLVLNGTTTNVTTDDLSEQQLVDCDTISYGCDGGFPDYAIQWATKNGLQPAKLYPYKATEGKCLNQTGPNKPNGGKTVNGTNMQSAITNYPISVMVDATNWSTYQSGIFNNCGRKLNHGALAVGFYEDGTWLLKNSWGNDGWGEKGFIRLEAGNTCGIQTNAYLAY